MSLLSTQKPETFLLSQEQQDNLPPASREALEQVDQLKYFLATAPSNWQPDQIIRRYQLPTGEYISCVLWDNLFHITGTDIVRSLTYRFFAFGRPVVNTKKFEEGIFSDLRNLKPGTDASLEEPKSPFLDLLYKNNCIRTQKKQKVFYWFSVPHDRLFLDALERDLKREKMNQEPTTRATAEPALSFYYDSSMTLFDQLTKAVQQSNSSATMNRARTQSISEYPPTHSRQHSRQTSEMMPPPMPQMAHIQQSSQEDYAPYILNDSHPLELEPPANIVQRSIESTPFVPLPYGHQQYRSAAMSCPPFAGIEYSPAPSFTGHLSSDEYAQGRAMTYAPETPPQSQPGIYAVNNPLHPYGLLPTPEASVTGDMYTPHGTDLILTEIIPGSMTGPMARPRVNVGIPNVSSEHMNVLQGSPTYKQRRRRTSISQHVSMIAPHTSSTGSTQYGPRPRAASVADGSLRNALLNPGFQRHTTPLRDSPYSRTTTPVQNQLQQPIFQANEELAKLQMDHDERYSSASPMPMDMRSSVTPGPDGNSPAKTFTCPVPACGRLFKRLEHLKRHVRTHTQERPYVCGICAKKFSRSDNLAQHRKTHERSGATQSPPTRNTPCDSARNTPVSGEEELDSQRQDGSQPADHFRYSNNSEVDHESQSGYMYPTQQSLPHNHFRSFSHDGHLNHYGLGPTSHGVNHLNGLHRATPPNEVEEEPQQPADNSPSDSDGSHSYHDEAPPSYAHQSNYSGMSVGTATLGVSSSGEIMTTPKDEISMQGDSLQKDYMPHTQIMDPSMMNQGWSYQ